jgi:hypothetical protein
MLRWFVVPLVVLVAVLAWPRPATYSQTDSRYFAETGHYVKGRFLQYWTQNGGLAQQGYPLTEEFQEKNKLDGKTYTVQYFERAIFEMHPENQPPFDVLLSQLGTFELTSRYPNNSNPAAGRVPGPTGGTPVVPTAPPTGGYSASVTLNNQAPDQNSDVIATGTLKRSGQPVAGAAKRVFWVYKAMSGECRGTTGSDGVATCEFEVSEVPTGTRVTVTAQFFDAAGTALTTAETFFTAR